MWRRLAAPADQLPILWLFHDEFAVWMLVEDYREIVSSTMQRLGVMARAAGIFLVFAAQRPEDRKRQKAMEFRKPAVELSAGKWRL